ncbi:hypothetical protein BRADI_2g18993v3 [Brachypodium distachyon]|uniref:Uncharacterized protein n=1 Tax=Brachypodium distachyon TaxID=15368 RepID=A0A0Q3IH77_BRADI|nr:hypothetical protein BRADI_2g18993v3 [Brachypodium distachyon]
MAVSCNRGSNKRSLWASVAMVLLLVFLLRCSPKCEGRKMPADQEEGEVMHFEGGLVLRVSPPSGASGEAAAAAEGTARGFSAVNGGRAARLMRSVPSPGVGH